MKILITGGAGFIGSNLVRQLAQGMYFQIEEIVVIDDLSRGKKEFIADLIDSGRVKFYQQSVLNHDELNIIFNRHKFDLIWHLSANSDISYGALHTDWDLKHGTLATYNILESMRVYHVNKIIFSSTSAVYGEATVLPTPENYGPLLPISLYGASKLACEGLIAAFSHNFNFQAWIFRFANIIGPNATHGAISDFMTRLQKNRTTLQVLGDGSQAKPYLHVNECISGMIFGFQNGKETLNLFNLACSGATTVKTLAEETIRACRSSTIIEYTGGDRGWVGDVAQVRLDSSKMSALGWTAQYSSDEAVRKAIQELMNQSSNTL